MRFFSRCVWCALWAVAGLAQDGGVVRVLAAGSGGDTQERFRVARDAEQWQTIVRKEGLPEASIAVDHEKDLVVALNDVDFCIKVRERGYLNVWTPYAELYHLESVSRGANDTPAKKKLFDHEMNVMIGRWGDLLRNDPYYSIHLSQGREDFSFNKG